MDNREPRPFFNDLPVIGGVDTSQLNFASVLTEIEKHPAAGFKGALTSSALV
jgi:hypothetical protein